MRDLFEYALCATFAIVLLVSTYLYFANTLAELLISTFQPFTK